MIKNILIMIALFMFYCNNSYCADNNLSKETYVFKNVKWGMSSKEIVHGIEKDKMIEKGDYDEKNRYRVCFNDNLAGKKCKIIYIFDHDKLVEIILLFVDFNSKNACTEFFNYLNDALNEKYEINGDIVKLINDIQYYKNNVTYITLFKMNDKISLTYANRNYKDKMDKIKQDEYENKVKEQKLVREKDKNLF